MKLGYVPEIVTFVPSVRDTIWSYKFVSPSSKSSVVNPEISVMKPEPFEKARVKSG